MVGTPAEDPLPDDERYREEFETAVCCHLVVSADITPCVDVVELELQPGVSGFRLSNQPILLVCPLQASLEVLRPSVQKSISLVTISVPKVLQAEQEVRSPDCHILFARCLV